MAKIPITIEIEKPVFRSDIIFQFMKENEIAFKGKDGTIFLNKLEIKNELMLNLCCKLARNSIRKQIKENKNDNTKE